MIRETKSLTECVRYIGREYTLQVLLSWLLRYIRTSLLLIHIFGQRQFKKSSFHNLNHLAIVVIKPGYF